MNIGEWLSKHIEEFGITLSFAFFGSAMLLWVTAEKQPLSANRAGMVIVAGQLVGSCAALFAFGYLLWPWFVSPLIGAIAGISAIPVIRSVIKIAQRGEDRAGDIADAGINRVAGPPKADDK